jgi:hypothetical protein
LPSCSGQQDDARDDRERHHVGEDHEHDGLHGGAAEAAQQLGWAGRVDDGQPVADLQGVLSRNDEERLVAGVLAGGNDRIS